MVILTELIEPPLFIHCIEHVTTTTTCTNSIRSVG